MKNYLSHPARLISAGKIILGLATIALVLPFFANAATLNNTFNVGTLFPSVGSTTNVSSTCGSGGANSNVSFALMQNGSYTNLSTNLFTDQTGAFSGNETFPASYSGSAILIATCTGSGDTINSPVLTFAAPMSSAFGLPQNSPSIGGIYSVTGACGNSNGTGTAQITLNQNGNNYNLDTVSLSPNATFSDNLVIPNSLSIGTATLSAVCSNNNRFSSTINIGSPALESFAFGTSPFPGSYTTISGNCTNISGNQNGAVSFSVLRSGTINNLAATGSLTNSSGYFSSSVLFPSNLGNQPATLVVTCPNGSTFSNVIMLGATSSTILASADPVGGVAAGAEPKNTPNFLLGGVLMITGILGLFMVTRKNFYAQK